MHSTYKVLLSVYVDDFKLGGASAHLHSIIERLRKLIHLDEATPLQEDVYLGLTQRNIPVPPQLLKEKQELFQRIVNAKHPTASPPTKEDMELIASVQWRKFRKSFSKSKGPKTANLKRRSAERNNESGLLPAKIGIDVGGVLCKVLPNSSNWEKRKD